eukprot:scpid67175/ scgid34974/ 
MNNEMTPRFFLAFLVGACVAAAGLAAKVGHAHRDVAVRSDSDDSASSDSDADGASWGGASARENSCFLTQTCTMDSNALSSQQTAQFNAIAQVLQNVVTSINNFVISARALVEQADAVSGVPNAPAQDCFVSASSGPPLRLNADTFAVELVATDPPRTIAHNPGTIGFSNLLVSYIFLNLPDSFGELQVDFEVDANGDLTGDPVRRFRTSDGQVFDLILTAQVCGAPTFCGTAQQQQQAQSTTLPRLPDVDTTDPTQVVLAAIAVESARCP